MPCYYRSNKIIPAPLMGIVKDYNVNQNGEKVGSTYKITISGTLVCDKGSPTSSGTFWTVGGYPPDEVLTSDEKLKSLLHKQDALRELFSEDGGSLEIQPWDFSAPVKCNPRVLNINFPEGTWYTQMPYTITLEADIVYGFLTPSGEDNFTEFLTNTSETWQIELNEQTESPELPNSYRLTHSLSAQGKKFYNEAGVSSKAAWEQARDWVQPRLGIDAARITASGALNLPSFMQGFNHVRSETIDESQGSYAITENWLLTSGNALEDFTVETRVSLEDGSRTVSINGTVYGLETRDSNYQVTQTKWNAASGKFDVVEPLLYNRAKTYSGIDALNITNGNRVVGRNPLTGIITYNYDFNDAPSRCVSGAKTEQITITEIHPEDIFATLPVLGRAIGPILQDIETIGVHQRQLSIEVVMSAVSGCTYAAWSGGMPDVTDIVDSVRPVASQVFKTQHQEVWNPRSGRYTLQISWTYQ